jgi:hypothetical protein
MGFFVLTGVPPLKASSVSAQQAGSEIHVVEGLFGTDKVIDGLMADRVSRDIMGNSAGDLLRA